MKKEKPERQVITKFDLWLKNKFGLKVDKTRAMPFGNSFSFIMFFFVLGVFLLWRNDIYGLFLVFGSIILILLCFRADIQGKITKFQMFWEVSHKSLYLLIGCGLLIVGIQSIENPSIPFFLALLMFILGIVTIFQQTKKIIRMFKYPQEITGNDREGYLEMLKS